MTDPVKPRAELLPCPFCNSAAKLVGSEIVNCSNQDCGAASYYLGIKTWNRRHPAQSEPVECAESIAYEQACLFILSLGYHWSDAEETWVKPEAAPPASKEPPAAPQAVAGLTANQAEYAADDLTRNCTDDPAAIRLAAINGLRAIATGKHRVVEAQAVSKESPAVDELPSLDALEAARYRAAVECGALSGKVLAEIIRAVPSRAALARRPT